MKLVQLNVWGGRLENQLKSFLLKEKADVLCLQEAISFNGSTGMFMTIEDMANLTGLQNSAIGPKFSFKYMEGTAVFSNCILSKYPIRKSEVVFTGLNHIDNFTFNEYPHVDSRNFVHVILKIGGEEVNILTHHGHHIPEHKNGDEETLKQMTMLGEYIDTLKGPVILTGDFNLAPHSESLDQINKRLTNLPVEHKLKTTRTSLTYKTEVCDYIFVNEEIRVNGFSSSADIVSDHRALILDFEL
jgi:endonuclease/exonuclease/phosphatase family metal-dependent hydrolase